METEQKKRAVIYCRVSTKEQVEEGNSLITQEKNCKDYAQKNGYDVAAIFVEQGESAKTADRTELKKLLSFCATKRNNINAIIAYKIDRISRNIDDYSQIRIQLKRYGVEIKSTSENFENNPAGRFMENIIANVAQFDNDVRAERSTGGMKDAVREGRYIWMAPFGYSNVKESGKSTIAPNACAPLVKKAFEEVALNLYPIEEIRAKLIREGLVNQAGKAISKSYFYHLLRNVLYTGWVIKFGERNKGKFEPIVSEELFQLVQQVLTNRRGKNKHYLIESPDFPLRRFFKHPSGRMLTGCWSKGRDKKYPYYLIHKFNINIRKEVLENIFKGWLNQFKMDIIHFEKLQIFVKLHLDKGLEDKKEEVERLQNKIPQLKAKQAILLDKNIEGIISNELCRERIAAIDVEIYQITKAITTLPKASINFSRLISSIRDFMLNPGDVWEKADFKTKIKLQWFYFPHGIEFDGIESRTTKICKLFILKEQISPPLSYMVHHPNSKSNTSNLQVPLWSKLSIDNTNYNTTKDEIFWQDLGGEIAYLASLMEKKDDQSIYPKCRGPSLSTQYRR